MSMTDPIADMLTRIRNANMMKHSVVTMPSSKIKQGIAEILKSEGFVESVKVIEKDVQNELEIKLKYSGQERVIKGLKRISKPGMRVYAKSDQLPKPLNGLGVAIISTSKGLITDSEARRQEVGGEVLAYIW